ncbi:MAG TPA: thiamine phosphate synthase [Candidatus Krumholzibacteria bacterium]
MNPHRHISRLCVITDTSRTRFGHGQLARLACAGGAGMIQLRDKELDDNQMVREALLVRDVCWEFGVPLILNDRVAVAQESRADGVHLGRTDLAVPDARARLGKDAIIGASAGSVEEAKEAEAAGASYIGFGHVFATSSKQKPKAPVGLEGLAAACAAVKIPVIAIGGITAANAADVIKAGAWGVAVIAEVCAAVDPYAATQRLRDVIDAQVASQTQ